MTLKENLSINIDVEFQRKKKQLQEEGACHNLIIFLSSSSYDSFYS